MDESGPSTAAVPPPPPTPRRVRKEPKPKEPKPKEVKPKVEAPAEIAESSTKGKGRRAVTKSSTTKRRRRARYDGSDSDEDSTLYDDDFSGNYTIRASREEDENGSRKSKRARRATPLSTSNDSNNSWNDGEIDPLCPLPGFIDPITLEQIIKPAISKYGHVMGYESWTRCLNNWEGKKNICPLTKNPLTKRDLGKK